MKRRIVFGFFLVCFLLLVFPGIASADCPEGFKRAKAKNPFVVVEVCVQTAQDAGYALGTTWAEYIAEDGSGIDVTWIIEWIDDPLPVPMIVTAMPVPAANTPVPPTLVPSPTPVLPSSTPVLPAPVLAMNTPVLPTPAALVLETPVSLPTFEVPTRIAENPVVPQDLIVGSVEPSETRDWFSGLWRNVRTIAMIAGAGFLLVWFMNLSGQRREERKWQEEVALSELQREFDRLILNGWAAFDAGDMEEAEGYYNQASRLVHGDAEAEKLYLAILKKRREEFENTDQ